MIKWHLQRATNELAADTPWRAYGTAGLCNGTNNTTAVSLPTHTQHSAITSPIWLALNEPIKFGVVVRVVHEGVVDCLLRMLLPDIAPLDQLLRDGRLPRVESVFT